MRQRWVLLPATLVVVGLITVFAGSVVSDHNDFEQMQCEYDQAVSGDPVDCEKSDGTVWYFIGGGLVVLGLLGFVIRSGTAAAIDETPSRRGSGSVTEELQRAADLHASGAITDEEFAAVKRRLFGLASSAST